MKTCGECKHWRWPNEKTLMGSCWCGPPTAVITKQRICPCYPEVHARDHACGQFKEKEKP